MTASVRLRLADLRVGLDIGNHHVREIARLRQAPSDGKRIGTPARDVRTSQWMVGTPVEQTSEFFRLACKNIHLRHNAQSFTLIRSDHEGRWSQAANDRRGCRMKRFMSGDPATQAVFTWPRALWTLLLAGLTFILYCLNEYRLLREEQIMLLIFLAAPIAAFFVSGKGQDMSDASDKTGRGINSRSSRKNN